MTSKPISASVGAEDYDDDRDLPDNSIWCDRCQGLGTAECYCGGDQCYCKNNGEMECPRCHGEGFYVPTPAQLKHEAEMREVLAKALGQSPTSETGQ